MPLDWIDANPGPFNSGKAYIADSEAKNSDGQPLGHYRLTAKGRKWDIIASDSWLMPVPCPGPFETIDEAADKCQEIDRQVCREN